MNQDFHYIAVLLDLLYGIEMEDEDLEELGLLAWELIGNKNIRLYRTRLCINPKDNSVTLPCNAVEGEVELVTSQWEDWERVTDKHEMGNQNSAFVEAVIEGEKHYQSPWYLPGKVLKYHQVGDKLYFTHNYGMVNILYKGVIMDESGLPQVTNKEALAIATYIAWVFKFRESLITNNKDVATQAVLLETKWNKQCDLARVTYLNLNDMDQILDISHSWDRKNYGKGYKVIK